MNKQIELIKAEIESLINQLNVEKGNSKHPFIQISINDRLATLEEVMDIINSLPKEPVSEDLKEVDIDFTVWLNERYNMTREEFEQHMSWEKKYGIELPIPKQMCYEERSCSNRIPNVDYDKLFVGAHLYMDSTDFGSLGCKFDEIEITHLYGGVLFYKFLEGKRTGEEDYISKHSIAMHTQLYPKVVMKPACIEMECDCPKTVFRNW